MACGGCLGAEDSFSSRPPFVDNANFLSIARIDEQFLRIEYHVSLDLWVICSSKAVFD